MESGTATKMYAEIMNGVPKKASRFVSDEESSQLWDEIAAAVEQMHRLYPGMDRVVRIKTPGDHEATSAKTRDER